MTENNAYDILTRCGIRPSVQRIAIMDYLLKHPTHPTVEDVYTGLYKDMPTLSRTTVYNTLRLLSEHNAARMITIDEHRVCYDGDLHPHVHFFCYNCEKVYDLMEEKAPVQYRGDLNGFLVKDSQLYYRGICPKCRAKVIDAGNGAHEAAQAKCLSN